MKKTSFFERLLTVIIAEFLVFAAIVILFLLSVAGVFTVENNTVKAFIGMLLMAVIFAFFLVIRMLLETYRYYKKLCRQFEQGEIYQEFIEHIGTLMPGLQGAVSRLDGLLDRQNVIQLSTKQAEFLALQNQINPHFLYNTLDAIRGDALCIGAENIADIAEALSTFFRYTITNTKNLVTLQAELDNVENYFKIQKYRFGDKLSLKVRMRDEEDLLLQMHCPKLSLQPIVENAIFHGVEKMSENGLINIVVEIVDQKLHIEITDNGMGMSESKLSQLNESLNRVSVGYIPEGGDQKKGGIALKNVCRRIKLLFGEEYGLHVNSIEGIGTRVEMILPVVLKNEEK